MYYELKKKYGYFKWWFDTVTLIMPLEQINFIPW